jgi:hypothetical protein
MSGAAPERKSNSRNRIYLKKNAIISVVTNNNRTKSGIEKKK